jgi:hypothetical protein
MVAFHNPGQRVFFYGYAELTDFWILHRNPKPASPNARSFFETRRLHLSLKIGACGLIYTLPA